MYTKIATVVVLFNGEFLFIFKSIKKKESLKALDTIGNYFKGFGYFFKMSIDLH